MLCFMIARNRRNLNTSNCIKILEFIQKNLVGDKVFIKIFNLNFFARFKFILSLNILLQFALG